jgi:hypothetical protein
MNWPEVFIEGIQIGLLLCIWIELIRMRKRNSGTVIAAGFEKPRFGPLNPDAVHVRTPGSPTEIQGPDIPS